ncbi:hypothetical protein NLI96_g10887 [Meripilus lineatus]|uniref:Translation elongation factor EFTu-like domain-containing protein n=1 Tax=Meripilus lineatus TaxID=2056292 RepID=A0AAD5UU94_9APHY|nr:hypothetical protein NLI96_g10887 [Physisporinus lineatus]
MTSLRTFQNEIDEIQHREIVKQRAVAHATQEKENKKAPAVPTSPTVTTTSEVPALVDIPSISEDMSANDEEIQTLLLSRTETNHDKARDIVASLLTQVKGEYIFRIGSHPAHSKIFAGESISASDGQTGTLRTIEELDIIKAEIAAVVDEVGGTTSILFESRVAPIRATLLLRLPPPSVSLTPEVRCAVVGNVDSGKSTTLGVLTRGALDDGRGRARVSLFRHKHEIESGRTSSVGMEILGFGPNGNPILPPITHSSDPEVIRREKLSWEEISIQASKIVSFIGMSKEHLAIALALSVPVVVCITKIDMTPPNKLAETVKQVTKILKSPGCRKTPVFVKSAETAVEISQVFAKERSVPYVGTVVDGIINAGRVKAGDSIMIGPDSNGNFQTTAIKSIQRKRAPVTSAEAGQCVSFALKRMRRSAVRKGMVIVSKTETPPRGELALSVSEVVALSMLMKLGIFSCDAI